MKSKFQDYFNFSKKELNGILVLCVLIGFVLILPNIAAHFRKTESYDFKDFDGEMKQFLASARRVDTKSKFIARRNFEEKEVEPAYFYFDPNGLSENSWHKLGLSARQVKVIKNYESKGGRFYQKKDLEKMYSLSSEEYKLLEPYIRIRNQRTANAKGSSYKYNKLGNTISSRSPSRELVEINDADSTSLETIRGIGPAFASRIVKYRNRLGGFYRKEQLMEVYGLDSALFERIESQVLVNTSSIRTININTATFEEIKRHPYLSYKQMNAILQYRKQHVNFESIDDLKKIAIMNEEILRKIEPYLTYQ
jgi:competence ComEA-like helix-hairpin-helix protein